MLTDIREIWKWLEAVPDPEIPVISVVDLGIVRNILWAGDVLEVFITPTYSGCPATSVISMDIETALRARGIKQLRIRNQLTPAWSSDWLTPAARERLKEYGIAPPQSAGKPDMCPSCNSPHVSKISQFGSTPCKAQWRCNTCLEPFDYFKCI